MTKRCGPYSPYPYDNYRVRRMELLGQGIFRCRSTICETSWFESDVCGCEGFNEPHADYDADEDKVIVECGECGACWLTLSVWELLRSGGPLPRFKIRLVAQ